MALRSWPSNWKGLGTGGLAGPVNTETFSLYLNSHEHLLRSLSQLDPKAHRTVCPNPCHGPWQGLDVNLTLRK